MVTYYLFLICEILLSRLPTRIGYLVAHVTADTVYLLYPRLRASVADNQRHVMGPEASEAAVRASSRKVLRNLARNYFDLIKMPHLKPEDIQRLVSAHNVHYLVDAVARGRGVVLVTAHYGSFDMAVQVLAARSVQTTILVEALRPERLLDHVVSLRQSQGLNVIPARSGALQAILRSLRQGEMVLFACDRDLTGDSPKAVFFGKETGVPDIAIRMALRTGAAIVPVFNRRRDDGRYDVWVEPPIEVSHGGNGAAGECMKQVIQIMEKYIRECPEQWVVLEPIWRSDGKGR